ncbi:MAG: hypothetical protein AW07_01451 [Candidatus Accumulibacter sp. SK-11]|nr:MAG: hypothetical protein AW07_01451 [Candidatus Accumulibacter sp. SK-11]
MLPSGFKRIRHYGLLAPAAMPPLRQATPQSASVRGPRENGQGAARGLHWAMAVPVAREWRVACVPKAPLRRCFCLSERPLRSGHLLANGRKPLACLRPSRLRLVRGLTRGAGPLQSPQVLPSRRFSPTTFVCRGAPAARPDAFGAADERYSLAIR